MRVAVVGAGAQAKEALEIFRFQPEIQVVGLIDLNEDPEQQPANLLGHPVLGRATSLAELQGRRIDRAIVCCSSAARKAELHDQLLGLNIPQVNAIHPSVIVAATATIEKDAGVILNAGVIIQPYARIGRGVVIHVNSSVDHDSVIEDFVNIAPKVCVGAWCLVKRETVLYIGASIVTSVVVGKRVIVGAGAVVLDEVPDDVTVVGLPARIVSQRNPEP